MATGGNDGLRVGDGGGEVGREEGAADCEVNGDGVLFHGGCEDEVDFRPGGEGGFEASVEGGFEVALCGTCKAGGGAAGEVRGGYGEILACTGCKESSKNRGRQSRVIHKT